MIFRDDEYEPLDTHRAFVNIKFYLSITYFSPVLWPDFSLWQLLAGVFFFQRQHHQLEKVLNPESFTQSRDWPANEKWIKLEQRKQVAEILNTWH